jgi:hypothetical protein
MRLLPGKRQPRTTDARNAVDLAITASAEAGERLASASEVRAGAAEQAAHEQRTIISELRAMRERNNLAALILDSVQHGRGQQ